MFADSEARVEAQGIGESQSKSKKIRAAQREIAKPAVWFPSEGGDGIGIVHLYSPHILPESLLVCQTAIANHKFQ